MRPLLFRQKKFNRTNLNVVATKHTNLFNPISNLRFFHSNSVQVDFLGKNRLINNAKKSLEVLKETRDNKYLKRLDEISKILAANPEIWDKDMRGAKKLAREQRTLNEKLQTINDLETSLNSSIELSSLAEAEKDSTLATECIQEIQDIAEKARKEELESLLSGPADHMGCYLEITVGSGGTEAMDFAGMLLRMYELWSQSRNFNVEVKEKQEGPEVGIRSAVLAIDTPYAYGWLRGEQGAHRICRISPYDAAQRRHTSFAQVAVFPMDSSQEEPEIELKESDLRFEAFRSGGPGGQSVNTTSSAVRVTHIPTGISVASQSERSQHRNKATALSILRAKLLAMELKARAEAQAKLRSALGEASFGSQVRTYYWNPQKFVKDHRSGYEENNAEGVLEGEKLQPFMEAYLLWESKK